MDFIRGLTASLPSMTASPAAPAFRPTAAPRAEGNPDIPSSPEALLPAQGLQILATLVGLLSQLVLGSQNNATGGTGSAWPRPGVNALADTGSGAAAAGQSSAGGSVAPVNGSSAAGNSGNNVAANASGTAFPVVGYQGKVGLHHGSNRGGADLFAPRGTPVVAMRGGTVKSVSTSGAGGNSVTLKGDDGLMYYYAHMDQTPAVSQGQKVRVGQQLGVVGDSGNAKGTGTHLHIGIGKDIVSGVGPAGGTGSDFDATTYLTQSLNAA